MKKRLFSMMTAFALVAGAMTSCQKDFTEDINKLQSDVNALSTQVSALDAQIKAGAVITSVTQSTTGVTVTLSNSQSFTITNGKDGVDGKDGKDGVNGTNGENGKDGEQGPAGTPGTVITIENGVWVIDGVPTEYKVSTEEVKVPFVNEEGLWVFYNEAGEEVVSNYRVTPVVAIENADGSYTLYVYDAEGNATEIKLPTAASAITDLVVLNETVSKIEYWAYTFTMPMKKTDWKGPRALPLNNSGQQVYIVSDNTADANVPSVQVNPANLEVADVAFSLINSQNKKPSDVVLKLSENKGLLTRSYGNGLYNVSMEDTFISISPYFDYLAQFQKQFKDGSDKVLFALTAGGNVRSKYAITVEPATAGQALTQVKVSSTAATVGSTTATFTANIGQWYPVTAVNAAALYDMYLYADANQVDLFGIEFINEVGNWKFRITKSPDTITPAPFTLNVDTIDKNGTKKTTKISVSPSSLLSGIYMADPIVYTIKNQTAENFKISLAGMKDVLGSKLTLWNTKVNAATIGIWKEMKDGDVKAGTEVTGVVGALLAPSHVNASGNASDINASSDIKVVIDNSSAGALSLDTEYYLKVTYKNGSNVLNNMIVPITFTAPKLADLFEIKTGYVDPATNAINAYFYKIATTPDKTVDLKKYFSKSVDDVYVWLDDETVVKTVGTTKYKSNQLGVVANPASFDNGKLSLNGIYNPTTSQFEVGYGEILNVWVYKDNYANWPYDAYSYDGYYFFTIRLASPIEQGTIKPVAGSSIVINGNDLVAGAKITDAMIKGYDYNNNVYNVVPDKVDGTTPAWANTQITDVTVSPDVNGYITSAEVKPAKTSSSTTVNGYFEVKGNSISQTVDVNMPVKVTDAWGYTKTAEVPVTIKKN